MYPYTNGLGVAAALGAAPGASQAGGDHVPSNGLRPRTDIHGLSRRADSYPAEPLVSFQINRQPSG